MSQDPAMYRMLWVSVIKQALDDAIDEPRHSLIWTDAVNFLTSPRPYWVDARAQTAMHLDLDGDDILRAGQRWIALHKVDLSPQGGPEAAQQVRPQREPMEPLPEELRKLLGLRHVVKRRPAHVKQIAA